jgi:hypothetical protein
VTADSVETLLRQAVARRLPQAQNLTAAVEQTARDLDLTPGRILRAYTGATTPEQEEAIKFLALDHGEPKLYSPLNPYAGELGLCHGDLVADFEKHTFVLWHSGGFSPIS